MEVTARGVVDRSIDDVWAYVSTVENMDEWVPGVSEVRRSDDAELEVGSRFSSKYTYRGETFDIDYEVTTYDPPRRLDIRSTDGPAPFAGSLRLAPVDGGTEVSNTISAGADGLAASVLFAAFGPVVRLLMRRRLAAELDLLAGAIEADGEPARVSAGADA